MNIVKFRKKIIVKIFAAPVWEGRLLEFVGVFAKRREEFEFALAIHTTVGIDAANLKLDAVNQRTAELTRRYVVLLYCQKAEAPMICVRTDIMLQLFQDFVTPQQRKLAAMVKRMGGDTALEDEQAMKELLREESTLATSRPGAESHRDENHSFNLVELQQEIKGNPDDAIEKNAEIFDRKFSIQRRQIVEDIARAIKVTFLLSGIYCDNCGSTLMGSRVVCVDCFHKTSLDFCSEPECIGATIVFEAADRKPHFPNHKMFKIHRIVFERDLAMIERITNCALDFACNTILQLKGEGQEMPGCVGCGAAVSLPCWCCAECTGELEPDTGPRLRYH